MGTICATTGLRIGEVLGLKWEDIQFATHTADVLHSYSDGAIGPCKTEIADQHNAQKQFRIDRWTSGIAVAVLQLITNEAEIDVLIDQPQQVVLGNLISRRK